MSDEPAKPVPPVRRRILRRLFLGLCLFIGAGFAALAWYVNTDSFQRMVRQRIIASAEKMTGGRVELGELHTIPLQLRIDARNLTIHGKEGPDQVPFLRVDRVQAELKIISLLSKTIGLHSLDLEHPVVHFIDYPDGTTNAPVPEEKVATTRGPVEQLLELSVSRIAVERGEFLWQDRRVPFEFSARDLSLLLTHALLRRQYETHFSAGSVATRIKDYPPFVWRADVALALGRNRVEIHGLTLTSDKSEFHFAGRLQDFHNPQLTGDYRGLGDLGELATFLRIPQLRKGSMQIEGKETWNLREFSTQGTVQAKDVEWADAKMPMRNGRLSAGFNVTQDRLGITSLKANLLGGELSGDAEVINWQNSPESERLVQRRRIAGRVQPGSQPHGTARLQLAGFPLAPELVLLSSRKLPLDRLNLSANTSGTVELSWAGSIRDADARLNLVLAPPASAAAGIPLRGQIDGTYRGSRDELELRQLQLTTPSSEISASGSLASTSTLKFSATSHNLKEWTPLLEAAYGSPNLPIAVHGWAGLSGNANGTLKALSFNGNLEVYDFETTLPTGESRPSRTFHWDALSAAVQYSNTQIAARNGSLIHGHAVAHFDGSATLAANTLPENAPFTFHFDLLNADVAELSRVAGLRQPTAGTLELTANLSGTRANPHGDGHLEIHDAVAYGVTIPLLKSDIRLANDQLQLNNIDTTVFGAPITGNAALGTSDAEWTKNQFRASLSGRNLDLARLPRFYNRFAVDGKTDFTARVSGTAEEPTIEAHIRMKDLAIDKERAGDFYVDAVTQGRKLDLKAHSDFEKADLSIAGNVTLEQDFPADLKLAFRHFDIDSILRIYLPGKITGHSPMDGTLEVRGPLRTPRDLKAVAEIQALSAEVQHVQVQSAEPIRFEVSDQVVSLEKFHLSGSGTDFTAHGRAHLTGAQELDFNLEGSANMALLQTLNPKILARGNLVLNLDATGSLSQPVLQGRLELKNTFVSHNDFPSGLSDLNGVLVFDRNRLQIENLRGTTGGGTVRLTGSASYQSGAVVLDLNATARDVRLRYPPGVSSTANANLRLTGTSSAAQLSGNVLVTKLAVTPGFDFAAYIEKSKQAVVLSSSDSLTSRLKLDVHVTTTPELQMQTAVARLSGNADLRVRGTVDRPAILGRVEVSEGEISFNGTKYKLERGDVTFANPAKTQPIIDVTATTRVRDYDITVQFRGDASAPNGLKVTWQSEPQLPEADVIALLAMGRTREESAASSGGGLGFSGEASTLLINEALNSTVNSRLQRLFGASRVKIDPQGLASETNLTRGPQVTVEQQVANNLTLTYSTNVSVSNQQIIQVEYNISRNMSIVALRDQNGVVSFDFKIRRRKK